MTVVGCFGATEAGPDGTFTMAIRPPEGACKVWAGRPRWGWGAGVSVEAVAGSVTAVERLSATPLAIRRLGLDVVDSPEGLRVVDSRDGLHWRNGNHIVEVSGHALSDEPDRIGWFASALGAEGPVPIRMVTQDNGMERLLLADMREGDTLVYDAP